MGTSLGAVFSELGSGGKLNFGGGGTFTRGQICTAISFCARSTPPTIAHAPLSALASLGFIVDVSALVNARRVGSVDLRVPAEKSLTGDRG